MLCPELPGRLRCTPDRNRLKTTLTAAASLAGGQTNEEIING